MVIFISPQNGDGKIWNLKTKNTLEEILIKNSFLLTTYIFIKFSRPRDYHQNVQQLIRSQILIRMVCNIQLNQTVSSIIVCRKLEVTKNWPFFDLEFRIDLIKLWS